MKKTIQAASGRIVRDQERASTIAPERTLTPGEAHKEKVLALRGKYAGIAPSVDDYLRAKHEEARNEDCR